MMLARLIALALSQRLFTLVLTLGLIGAGLLALRDLPIDAFPDVSSTQVKIILKAPGMTPAEVESRIVAPLEQELLGIPRQVMLRSSSKYAIADITLDFADGTDIYWARQQVSERLNGVMGELPPGIGGGLAPITTPLGGMVQTFEVVPDMAALAARHIALSQLQAALEGNNRNDGAGRLQAGEESLLVRSEGSIRNLDDVRAIAITARDGQSVRVGDLATVRLGELARYGAVTRNGTGETVQGLVLGLRGANARQLVREVRATLDALGPTLPPGITIVPFYDRGQLVDRAVGTVTKALGEAIVLVGVLLLLFLGNLRAALVVALILPLSALATFVLMQQWGLSANLMSLGGLAIAIGMLVDAAVVVVENIEARQSSLHGPALALPNRYHVY